MKINDFINELAVKIGKLSLVKKILRKPYDKFKCYQAQKKVDLLQKHGLEALRQFHSCMVNNGYKYQLAFGTLLGAIREHDFIPHDDDLDFTMWIDDYDSDLILSLKNYGFKHIKSFSVNNDNLAKEDSFEYKGIPIDIFYIYKDENGNAYTCYFDNQPGCVSWAASIKRFGGLSTRKIYLSANRNVKKIHFKGIEVTIPENYDSVLKKVFGDNYLTPIPGWSHKDNSEHKPDWLCKYTEY